MSNCFYCKKTINDLPYNCKFCGNENCSDHRLPESHNCEGLEKWKEDKTVEKLVYHKNEANEIKKEFNKKHLIILILIIIATVFVVFR